MTRPRRFATAALLVVLAVTLLLTVPSLDEVFERFGTMSPGWVAAALVLELASCLAFVVVFRFFFDTVAPAVARRVAGRSWRPALSCPAVASRASRPVVG
jgi:hypothetical protein